MASLATASFDILLNMKVGGVSIRLSMILQAAFVLTNLISTGISKSDKDSNYAEPLGFKYLAAWGLFLIIWTPRTYDMAFSIGYTAWFILSAMVVFCAVNFYKSRIIEAQQMLQFYIHVYVAVAVFGLLQFMLGLVGVDLLVTQWWIHGRLPRLNGLSYEPSYYATYLITGWGMLAWQVERRVMLFSKVYTQASFLLVSVALILSSSRMAFIVVAAYAVFYLVKNIAWTTIHFKLNLAFVKIVALCSFVTLAIGGLITATVGFGALRFLLFGTGLGGTANHSATIRAAQLEDTITLIRESPLIGYGLGGIWSVIAKKQGLEVSQVTGMNITAEVLAATGALGFPFFVMFIITLFIAPFRILKKQDIQSEILAASGVGFILLFIILQFNQSILRLYLWNHIAVMAVLYYYASRSHTAVRAASRTRVGPVLARQSR